MVSKELEDSFIRTGMYLRNWSKRTAHTYRAAFISLRKFKPEAVLSKAELENWVCWLRDTGVTPGGCNMYIRTVNSFLTWLAEEQKQEPLTLKLLKAPPKLVHSFSDSDIRLILSFRPKGFYELRTWTLVNLLLDTGIRIDEALNARRDNVDFENLLLTVNGKGNKPRRVPISIECRKTLFRYTQRPESKCFVFSTRHGDKLLYRNIFRDIEKLCKKAGITRHVHPHLFRHCFAVTYVRRGGDIYRLSRILGHTSISTTQIYLRSMGIEQIAENHSSLSPLSYR